MSRTGIAFCIFYMAIAAVFISAADDAGGDHKGRFVALQLPLALQMDALELVGLRDWFSGTSWVQAYIRIGSLTLLVLYLAGWGLSRLVRAQLAREKKDAG